MFPFLYGFLIASDPRFEAALRRCRWPLAVACAATGALAASAAALTGPGAGLSARAPPGWSALQGLAGWAWIAALLGFAGSAAARRGGRAAGHARPAPDNAAAGLAPRRPVRQRSGAALLPAARAGHRHGRMAHRPLARADPAKYAALVIVSFAATLGLYETLIRRFRITRLLFGLKPPIKPRAAEGPAQRRDYVAATGGQSAYPNNSS